MANRRDFLKTVAGTAAGMLIANRGFSEAPGSRTPQGQAAAPAAAAKAPRGFGRRQAREGGGRARALHDSGGSRHRCRHEPGPEWPGGGGGAGGGANPQVLGPDRLRALDERGIDVQVLDINGFWWYAAERDLASKIVDFHNEKLAAWCNAHSDRFVALTSVALQFPDLAAQQLEHAVKELGLRGAAIGGHVEGEALSAPKYDPFWAKAEELQRALSSCIRAGRPMC